MRSFPLCECCYCCVQCLALYVAKQETTQRLGPPTLVQIANLWSESRPSGYDQADRLLETQAATHMAVR